MRLAHRLSKMPNNNYLQQENQSAHEAMPWQCTGMVNAKIFMVCLELVFALCVG